MSLSLPPLSHAAEKRQFGLLDLVSRVNGENGALIEIYHIPNDQVGRVIGKGGESINRLQDVTGCRIQIATDNGTQKREGTLTGTRPAIDKAREMINDIVAQGHPDQQGGDALALPGGATAEVPIPSNRVGLIIGRGGETIKRLQDESGARLQMVQDDPFVRRLTLELWTGLLLLSRCCLTLLLACYVSRLSFGARCYHS